VAGAAVNYTKLVLHSTRVFKTTMKNVTITLDEETATWARVYAATHNMSVSRLVGEMLRRRMGEQHEYDQAMRRFLAKKPIKFKGPAKGYPKRDELYDRGRLR